MAASTVIDKAIGLFSPGWQLRRVQSRAKLEILARYYDAGDLSRRTVGWKRPTGDANAVPAVTLQRLRDSARQLVRNNGYAESAIGTIVDDTVGTGILPTSTTPRFKDWASSTQIDVEGRNDLPGLEQLVIRTVVESGEALVRRRFRRLNEGLAIPLQIEVLEPDFIDTSKHHALDDGGKIVRGVEYGPDGRRRAYWLFKEHPGSTTISNTVRFGSSERTPASEILHVFKGARPGQVRGASWYAPVLIRFSDFDEYADATLMKQKIAALLSVLTTDVDGLNPRLGGEEPTDPTNDQLDSLEPGLILNVPPGRSVEVVEPPSVREYPDFVRTTLHEIASGIGVTPEDLTGDYSNMNFSSARMSRIRHWGRVTGWRRRMLVPQFLTPVFSWAMDVSAAAGFETVTNDGWTAPPLPMIEPDKEGLAIVRNIRGGIQTPSDALRERGYDPDRFWEQYEDDFRDLDERGIVLDSDARKMTQAGIAQFTPPYLQTPPDGPPEEEDTAPPSSGNGNGSSSAGDQDDDDDDFDDLLSVSDAAARYGFTAPTIRSWIQKGAIRAYKVGPSRALRVRARDMVGGS